MSLDNFIEENSFHDSFIVKAKYDLHGKALYVRLVQLCSELSLHSELEIDIKQDDLVEVEIQLEGVDYICHDISKIKNNEIISVDTGTIGKCDILMVQLYNDNLYKEIYIRGNNIDIKAKILGIYTF